MSSRIHNFLPLLPPLLLALIVFVFSSFPAEGSDAQSGFIVKIITDISPSLSNIHFLTTLVRKSAHFAEYTLLGFFAARAFSAYGKSPFLSIPVSIAYATTDELHQLLVPGRSCELTDILLDSVGISFGVILYILLTKLHHKH